MSIESLFLEHSAATLRQMYERIETCLGKLGHDQIWARGGDNENAIGNLVLHLAGNVRQWILSALGGQPDSRNRDEEFAARGGLDGTSLATRLGRTVSDATEVILSLQTGQLMRTYSIQSYSVSGLAAVYHVVEHFAQHTGQIIFATKMLTGEDLGFYRHLRAAAHGEKTP